MLYNRHQLLVGISLLILPKMKYILVLDDDPSIMEVMKIILEEKGYQVDTIDNFTGLIGILKKKKPDLIFIDIWMKGQNGNDITRQIKRDNLLKQIPIVIISANDEIEKITRDSGADDYLSKPFEIDDLVRMVTKHISP
jgi:CheY-like chemotaxis protein